MNERHNPTDHARTAHPRAGEWFKNSRDVLGLAMLAVGVMALAGCLFSAAYGETGLMVGLMIIAVLTGLGGAVWLFVEGRRVRQTEGQRRHRVGDHPNP